MRRDLAPVGAPPSGALMGPVGFRWEDRDRDPNEWSDDRPSWRDRSSDGASGRDSKALLENRVFIQGLPKECTDEELRGLIEQITDPKEDEIVECRTIKGKGCGFVAFREKASAENVLEGLEGRKVNGWPDLLKAQWADPPKG